MAEQRSRDRSSYTSASSKLGASSIFPLPTKSPLCTVHRLVLLSRTMSEKLKEFVDIPQQFVRDGNQFLTRCTKPSHKEFIQISKAVAIGFAVMGFIGYFVKLIHIPINNILVGGA
ncbi:hypothetical protein C8Q74DRAFT_1240230 [Fomes fomentarius]|nr:hypothetical protein C8Q74DRAFT_1240230 [Fomes fomentarius]